MTLGEWSVLSAYFACMALLAVYGLHRLCLVVLHLRHRSLPPFAMPSLEALPVLTVQLPIYNESYVAGRVLDAACALAYPKHRLEIQTLDDSTDETGEPCRRQDADYGAPSFPIHHR